MNQKESAEFGPLRSIFWPIHRHELKIVLPMLLILFFTTFNYSLLRNLKDVIVVTAESKVGGEIIPFIKVYAMLPGALLSAYIFTKLTNRFSQEKVYYIIISTFLLYFALFGFLIYPSGDALKLNAVADALQTVLPTGLRGFVAMVRNWTFTIFYVMCELWGSIALTVLFWGFANEITKVKEAPRYYSLFGVVSSLSAVIAGILGAYFSKFDYNPLFPYGKDAWEQTLITVLFLILCMGTLTLVIFWWMNRYALIDHRYDALHAERREMKVRKKQSLRESFRYLANSRYLICIAVIVVSYNLVMNLSEVVWKDQLKHYSTGKNDFFVYLNTVTMFVGLISAFIAFFVGKIIRRFGWTNTALITPSLMLVTSLGFFGFMFLRSFIGEESVVIMGMTPLAFAVTFGAMQNCTSKACKYSVFDATKEMAFIPLDHDSKLKGKAAIDGVGSRLGKSGGSLIHQGLLYFFTSLTVSAPYVAAILVGAIFAWMTACRVLGVEFAKLAKRTQDLAEGVTDQVEEKTPEPLKA